jgi:signal transduction protein with GAF and PtsI domain
MEKKEEIKIPWGTGIVGYVAESGEPVNIPDAYKVSCWRRVELVICSASFLRCYLVEECVHAYCDGVLLVYTDKSETAEASNNAPAESE